MKTYNEHFNSIALSSELEINKLANRPEEDDNQNNNYCETRCFDHGPDKTPPSDDRDDIGFEKVKRNHK